MNNKILIIEDDDGTAEALSVLCNDIGLEVDRASNKEGALTLLQDNAYQLVTIDIMLGIEKNAGINIISFMNQNSLKTPILVISGMDPTIYSDITLNMLGVWDFIAKPYDGPSLITKINRLIKHSVETKSGKESILEHKGLVLNVTYPSKSTWKSKRMNLTLTQCRLITLLIESKGSPVSYSQFYKVIDTGHNTSNVRSHIKKIRALFKDIDRDFALIQAVPSVGYILLD